MLLLVTFSVACGQKADDTFTKPIYFNQPVYLYGGVYIGTDPALHLTWPTGTGSVADWNTMINKPLTFPPSVHDHDLLYKALTYVPIWTEITDKPTTYPSDWTTTANKPGEIELGIAISQLSAIKFPVLTQAQIDTLVPELGFVLINSTANAMQWYNGTKWQTFPTTN